MNTLTNEWLVFKLCMVYFHRKKGMGQKELGIQFGVDHATISRWENLTAYQRVNRNSYDLLLKFIDQQFPNIKSLIEFCDCSMETVEKLNLDSQLFRKTLLSPLSGSDGKSGKKNSAAAFSASACFRRLVERDLHIYASSRKNIDFVSKESLSLSPSHSELMLDQLSGSMPLLLNSFRRACENYRRYFTVEREAIHIEPKRAILREWLVTSEYAQMHNSAAGNTDVASSRYSVAENCVIISFSGIFRIGIVFTNYNFDSYQHDFYKDKALEGLFRLNQLNLMVIFTDNTVLKDLQHYLHVKNNCMLIPVNNKNVKLRISHSSMHSGGQADDLQAMAEAYAAEAFHKLVGIFPMVKDALVYQNYARKALPAPALADEVHDSPEFFRDMSDFIIHKIHNYSYLTRHTIYFERSEIREHVLAWLSEHNRKNLNCVVEMNFSSGLLSSNVYDLCDHIVLIDNSVTAAKTLNNIFYHNMELPEKVEPHIADIHYDDIALYASENLREQKADLIILGAGSGSNIPSLIPFLRNITQWLSPDGMLYISFLNRESVLFLEQEEQLQSTGISYSPIGSRYIYSLPDNLRIPVSAELWLHQDITANYRNYFTDTSIKTYPFLSATTFSNLKDREMLDEIRRMDKQHASEGRHGHFILSFARNLLKSSVVNESLQTNDPERIVRTINNILERRNHLPHPQDCENPTYHKQIQTRSQFENMVSNSRLPGTDTDNYAILKLVLLRSRKKGIKYEYHILSIRSDLPLESEQYADYVMVPEPEVTALFGLGTLSPLLVLREITEMTGCEGKIIVHKDTFADKDYVILSEGSNTCTISMRTRDFLKDLETL